MKSLRNSVQLIGNLGQDPVITEFDGGKKASFSLATNHFYKTREGVKEVDTQWHNIIAWGKMANLVEQHLKKGIEVMIAGHLVYRSYETPKGEKRRISEIVTNEVIFTPKS